MFLTANMSIFYVSSNQVCIGCTGDKLTPRSALNRNCKKKKHLCAKYDYISILALGYWSTQHQ